MILWCFGGVWVNFAKIRDVIQGWQSRIFPVIPGQRDLWKESCGRCGACSSPAALIKVLNWSGSVKIDQKEERCGIMIQIYFKAVENLKSNIRLSQLRYHSFQFLLRQFKPFCVWTLSQPVSSSSCLFWTMQAKQKTWTMWFPGSSCQLLPRYWVIYHQAAAAFVVMHCTDASLGELDPLIY